jgi:hypothetical protein
MNCVSQNWKEGCSSWKENFKTNSMKKSKNKLPANLASGIENLSGIAIDNVQVHYNSPQPELLEAHAFAQGREIHLAPGQEKHLPHEAWHVVQQKQGRVKPTLQMKGVVNINDDQGLEKEADVMGEKATHPAPTLSRGELPLPAAQSGGNSMNVSYVAKEKSLP